MRILIKKYPVTFPETPKVSTELQELIRDLLNKDYTQRLGSEGIDEILSHQFFMK
jgi:hypothetical protein